MLSVVLIIQFKMLHTIMMVVKCSVLSPDYMHCLPPTDLQTKDNFPLTGPCVSENTSKDDNNIRPVAWSAFHAQSTNDPTPAEAAMLPLFHEKAASPAMMKHVMSIAISVTKKMNSGQTPVLFLDQPLYAIAKQLQWQHNELGEDKLVIMLGGLHIEMAIINVIGLLLESSGWCETLSASGLTTVGRAQSLTGASHIKNARYAHQATCATLHSLMKGAYLKDMEASVEKNKETFEQWQKRCRNEYPLFAFWAMILDLEVLYNIFIRALQEGNFKMHLEVLVELMPWLCALDRVHYRRWLPVYLRDMAMLENIHPECYQMFMDGHFVASRTTSRFSAMSLDQVRNEKWVRPMKGPFANVQIIIKHQKLQIYISSCDVKRKSW